MLLSQQIRLKALAVMEQTCSQPLHSEALCQSYGLLGPYRQFRHRWTPPIHTCTQTYRCPHTCAYTQMAHALFLPGCQMGGCKLFTCDPSCPCHLSVRANNTRHIRGMRPAGHHSAKHVKRPAESLRLLELPVNASTSQITAPGV